MAVITVAVEDGKKEFKYLMLAGNDLKSTQTAVARAVTQLKKLGVEGVDLEDFLNGAEKLAGTRVRLSIKTIATTGRTETIDSLIFFSKTVCNLLPPISILRTL